MLQNSEQLVVEFEEFINAMYFSSIKQMRVNKCIVDIKQTYTRNLSTQFIEYATIF